MNVFCCCCWPVLLCLPHHFHAILCNKLGLCVCGVWKLFVSMAMLCIVAHLCAIKSNTLAKGASDVRRTIKRSRLVRNHFDWTDGSMKRNRARRLQCSDVDGGGMGQLHTFFFFIRRREKRHETYDQDTTDVWKFHSLLCRNKLERDLTRTNNFCRYLIWCVCVCCVQHLLSNQINYQINVRTNQHGLSSGNEFRNFCTQQI